MEFIEPVLTGCFSRIFDSAESENPDLFEPHLEKIRAFLEDKTGYWVREKALLIVTMIEWAEGEISQQRYKPSSPKGFVDAVLKYTQERIADTIKTLKVEGQEGLACRIVPLPILPKQK
jgi:hypothetical protein